MTADISATATLGAGGRGYLVLIPPTIPSCFAETWQTPAHAIERQRQSFYKGNKKKAGQRKNVSALSMVPGVGIEPTHLSVLDFESSASTNSTTRALIREPELWHSVGYEISNH